MLQSCSFDVPVRFTKRASLNLLRELIAFIRYFCDSCFHDPYFGKMILRGYFIRNWIETRAHKELLRKARINRTYGINDKRAR